MATRKMVTRGTNGALLGTRHIIDSKPSLPLVALQVVLALGAAIVALVAMLFVVLYSGFHLVKSLVVQHGRRMCIGD